MQSSAKGKLRLMQAASLTSDPENRIPIHERVELPEELIPADSRVEIDAKITAGKYCP